MAGRVLADTNALLALAHPRDQNHQRAAAIARRHLASSGRYVGTVLVLAELHAHVLHRRGPHEARTLVSSLVDDAFYEWVDVPLSLIRAASSAWLERFGDQRFSLTDAVSFEVMRRQKLSIAFTFDEHFETAGFELLR